MHFRLHDLLLVFLVVVTVGCGGAAKAPVQFGLGLPTATATPAVHTLERAHVRACQSRPREKTNYRRSSSIPSFRVLRVLTRWTCATVISFHMNHPRFGLLEARLHRAGYLFRTARENLAEAPTVDESEEGLLKSPHHYENLMAKDITHIGIGIVQGGVQDPHNLTVTQIFSTPGKLESDTEAARALTNAVSQARATGRSSKRYYGTPSSTN